MMLSLIRQAVGNDFLILCDSGIRRGSDIFKALALGADAVLIGRPIMYALATAGPLGVAHMLRILKDELQLTMALCGCASIADISTKHLITLQT
jgi:4-hydroxymandelate oxidase